LQRESLVLQIKCPKLRLYTYRMEDLDLGASLKTA
jgi:hypothetical protein